MLTKQSEGAYRTTRVKLVFSTTQLAEQLHWSQSVANWFALTVNLNMTRLSLEYTLLSMAKENSYTSKTVLCQVDALLHHGVKT